jgi:hypothetical protein
MRSEVKQDPQRARQGGVPYPFEKDAERSNGWLSGPVDRRCNNGSVVRLLACACATAALLVVGPALTIASRLAPIVPAFDRPAATVGERVTVRASGFASRKPLRVYLAPRAEASRIRGPFDRRLHFVGVLNPRSGRASTTFVLPPLSSGGYAIWCRGCRSSALLSVTMPAATPDSCPTTMPSSRLPAGLPPGSWLGNGLLWTWHPPGGVWNVPPSLVQPDGTLFNKQQWVAKPMFGKLAVRLERLDLPTTAVTVVTVSGHLSGWGGPSWAARMRFPTPGCWLVQGRVKDVALSYVVKVVLQPSPRKRVDAEL